MTSRSTSQESISGSNGPRLVGSAWRQALYGVEATRHIECDAMARLPAHDLMARAGLSVARLALALQPHAQMIWVACGPGNNGGDGLVAATHLHRWSQAQGGSPQLTVTHWTEDPADESRLPADARNALTEARKAGVVFAEHPPARFDLAIDALLGIGATRPAQGQLGDWLSVLRGTSQPVLCVDLPSGLAADTGTLAPSPASPAISTPGRRYTLSLLNLKPGLFTAHGRDAAGQVWLDDLGIAVPDNVPVLAWLSGQQEPAQGKIEHAHAGHKGSYGDVIVIGGQAITVEGAGMTGAAVLAARAALHAGAGRVFVGLLQAPEADEPMWDPVNPELMFRRVERVLESASAQQGCVVCGCGGGSSVAAVLPRLLSKSPRLLLDADALNAIAADSSLRAQLTHRKGRGWATVITPHPLEAARLLDCETSIVMADRLKAAQTLADSLGVVCVLKGSGTVLAAPNEVPWINPTGNAALATAGTGDVLAGMVGGALARLAKTDTPIVLREAAAAVYQHGWLADSWPTASALSASTLAARVRPCA